jgi:predicted GH43/DUF377 family glycosyl hydrolase
MKANISRVITRPYMLDNDDRARNIIDRVLKLSEDQAVAIMEIIIQDFSHRHRYFRESLERHFQRVASHVPDVDTISPQRRLLIGAYFTQEYSIESAALFNPSIVQVSSQETDPPGSTRFVMSFRATGEGHISSIEFRSGIIDSNNDIYFDPLSDYVDTPEININPSYDGHAFRQKLHEMGADNMATQWLLNELPDEFTYHDLLRQLERLHDVRELRQQDKDNASEMVMWLARSNYHICFREDHPISERVIFPVSQSESQGIEDARFVRFVNDDGTITYYATYTAYNGETILPQLIETSDFLQFKIKTLNGVQAQGKGLALFPRKVGGNYVMLSRQDGEKNSIMFSDKLHMWQHAQVLQEPIFPHELVQMGNSGSPIETPEGWLLITHGVGPMRTYSLGIELLDLEDPTRIISRIREPILVPTAEEREGYVPNVVYSCGALIHQGELIIPYAAADQRCSIATLQVSDIMSRLEKV